MSEEPKRRYAVSASVTISLNAYVYARSEKEALMLAENLALPTIHEDERLNAEKGASDEEWRTSGELDGFPFALSAEEEEEEDDTDDDEDEDDEDDEDEDEDADEEDDDDDDEEEDEPAESA